MDYIIKRDGRKVEFNETKIINAVIAAMEECDGTVDASLARNIADAIHDVETICTVEQIQDMVESMLMDSSRQDVAKAYILYRAERTKQRDLRNQVIQQVYAKTSGSNIENSNANVDEATFGGRKNEAASALQKSIALDHVMSQDIAQAHKDGLIYQHDLDHYNVGAHNCLFIDFKKIFENGFSTRNGDVRSPGSFSTACQLVAVAFQIQSQCQYGGVGSVHIDTDLAPYVRLSFAKHYKDGLKYLCNCPIVMPSIQEMLDNPYGDWHIDEYLWQKWDNRVYSYAMEMLEREGKQAAQGLYHNLNTLESRAGSQVPFTSINLGRDTTPEGRLVTKWLLEASIEGIGKHHTTSIFPISIFSYKKGVNVYPGDPNYDLKQLALKSLARRIYPNWCNGEFSEAHEEENNPDSVFSTMG